VRELIYSCAILNAAQYGKADSKAVLARVLARRPEYRKRAREIIEEVEWVVKEVNSLNREEINRVAEAYAIDKTLKDKKGLGELPKASVGKVRLRFAPNPSGPLHLGHSRAAILNDEYARRYEGELLLRFEDTDPKRVDVEAYDQIREDLEWLDVKSDDELLQSNRLETYYKYARILIEMGSAYVCACPAEEFKKLREASKPCSCREEKNTLEQFEMMFNDYGEGEAVLRLKTDLKHKNTSIRDFPIMRIVETPHPLVGDKRVYPLMNLSVAIDDHELKLTHILRGKDHILNTHKQAFIFDCFEWKKPVYIHYGLLKIGDVMLSTSEIKKGITNGVYSGWDDVKLGTILSLARRGIKKEAVRKVILDVGIKQTDISFSWKNLYAFNKELIDPLANRYSFVESPRKLIVKNAPKATAKNRLHPTLERGVRVTELRGDEHGILLSDHDFRALKKGRIIRLMGAYNVEISIQNDGLVGRFHGSSLDSARKEKASLINWVYPEGAVNVKVLFPDKVVKGLGEAALKDVEVGEIVQFERFGFVRIDGKNKEIIAVFTHK
jgi:glutamyl-tRNA synthetase